MRIRFATAMFTTFLAVAVIPLLVFWQWPHSEALTHEIASVKERHLLLAQNISAALSRYHRDLIATFEVIAEDVAGERDYGHSDKLLNTLGFRGLCMVDGETGRVVLSIDTGIEACPDRVPAERLAFFRETAEADRTRFSGVEEGPDGSPVLFMLRRYGDRIMVGLLDTGYFRELGRQISFGERGHAAIVDHRGRLLAHPLEEWWRTRKDISAVSAVQRLMNGDQGVEIFYSPALQADMIAGLSSVEGPGWGVMIPQPVAELHSKANRIERSALIVLALGVALALAAASLVTVYLLRALSAATRAAQQISHGDGTAVRIPESTPLIDFEEIEEMKSAFNRMVERIEASSRREMETRERAERANDTKTRFLANVSHELRTPLNAIIGFSDMMRGELRDRITEPKRKEYLNDIHQSASYLLDLINDLLDISRIESGNYQMSEQSLDIEELMQGSVAILGPEAKTFGQTIRIENDMGNAKLRADGRAIHQILLNLLSNAVRYNEPGCRITLSAHQVAESGCCELSVADNGRGIPRDAIERLKEPFQRIERDVEAGVQGTGLGLPIVQRLAHLHGGIFYIESDVGEGTRATVRLPVDRVEFDALNSSDRQDRHAPQIEEDQNEDAPQIEEDQNEDAPQIEEDQNEEDQSGLRKGRPRKVGS